MEEGEETGEGIDGANDWGGRGAKYRGGEADSKSRTRRNRWSNSLLRFYRPVSRPDTDRAGGTASEASISGKESGGGGRTNELNRRKKKFWSRAARIGQDFYSSFMI